MVAAFVLFITLLFWHALADYPLQGDFIAKAKAGLIPELPWQLGLFTHAYIHAFGVMAITGNVWAGFVELGAHTTIDYFKARRHAFSIPVDQSLHVLTKVLIVMALRGRAV